MIRPQSKVLLTLLSVNLSLIFAMGVKEQDRISMVEAALPPKTVSPVGFPTVERVKAQPTPLYPYSLVPGGVSGVADFCERRVEDKVVAYYTRSFNCDEAWEVVLTHDVRMFMAYKRDGRIFWTKHPVVLVAGSKIITDGARTFAERCGNEIAWVPLTPTESNPPDISTPTESPEPATHLVALEEVPTHEPSAPVVREIHDRSWWLLPVPVFFRQSSAPSTWTPPPSQDCELEVACR